MTGVPGEGAPADGEIEISVFGPGVGECIVVHMGAGEWIVVDSCRDRRGRRPRAAALCYFDRIGVDPAHAVKSIVATHWDSDHIRALGEVVEACPNASFWCSAAVGCVEFDALLDLTAENPTAMGLRLREISRIVASRRARLGEGQGTPSTALESSLIFEGEADRDLPRRAIHALSPSPRSLLFAFEGVRATFGDPSQLPCRVQQLSQNDVSVALLVAFGRHAALLGADLERSDDPGRGWKPAVRRARELGITSSLVKVPHHGSSDAHDAEMWRGAVDTGAVAVVTPFFCGGSPLPKSTDRDRIREYTSRAYLTTGSIAKQAEPPLLMLSLPAGAHADQIEGSVGHVRWRRALDGSDQWRVEADEQACPV